MNYFQLHIGDYAEATAHLSIMEDGVYFRLLRKYYASESALPADPKQIQRLIGARTAAERAAVEMVLEEFFALDDEGWHNARCDEYILEYRRKMEAVQGKRGNEKDRQARARAHRKGLAAELAKHGIKVTLRTTTEEMEAELSRVTSQGGHGVVTRDDIGTSRGFTRLSQSPISNLQSPVTNTHKSGECVTPPVTGVDGREPPEPPSTATPPEDIRARWLAVRGAYPAHTHPEADWMLAEREAVRAVDDGLCTWDHWFNAATRYAAQIRAMGREGTQFVTKPSNWFQRDRRSWTENFPAPAAPRANGKHKGTYRPTPSADEYERMTAQGMTWTPETGWSTPA